MDYKLHVSLNMLHYRYYILMPRWSGGLGTSSTHKFIFGIFQQLAWNTCLLHYSSDKTCILEQTDQPALRYYNISASTFFDIINDPHSSYAEAQRLQLRADPRQLRQAREEHADLQYNSILALRAPLSSCKDVYSRWSIYHISGQELLLYTRLYCSRLFHQSPSRQRPKTCNGPLPNKGSESERSFSKQHVLLLGRIWKRCTHF